MCFFWVHSAFLSAPPPAMGGVARALLPEECDLEGLAPGSWSLTLNKQEIDRAAKDTRCAHFDPDFRVEVFFTPTPGQAGTGPALEEARAAASAADDPEADAAAQPLKADRDAYRRYAHAAAVAGRDPVPFQAWLLGADAGPDPRHPASLALAAAAAGIGRAPSAALAGGLTPAADGSKGGGAARPPSPWALAARREGTNGGGAGAGRAAGYKADARLEVRGEEVARGETRPSRGESLPLMPEDGPEPPRRPA